MTKETQIVPRHHVLMVDADRDYLTLVSDVFHTLSENGWQIRTATSWEEALKLVEAGKIQLVIMDGNASAPAVAAFLGALRQQHPQLKKVVMTAIATDANRAASSAAGADLFLEKPVSPEGLKAAFTSMSDLLGWKIPQSFSGMLRSISLADLVQMECLASNSSILELYREQSLGRIYIEKGQIIHAVCGELAGERAFQKLFNLTGGTFELHDFEPPPERTLNRTWEYLLGEATRLRDFLNARSKTGEADSAGAESGADQPAGKTLELLICSGTGEEIYNWQCSAAAARVALLQNIARCAEQIIPELKLGKLDRVEVRLPDSRVILQSRPDRLIFARIGGHQKPHEK